MTTTPPVVAAQRDDGGRFLPGHARLGGRRRGTLDLALVIDADTRTADLRAAYTALAAKAGEGDVPAIRALFDRLLGPLALAARIEMEPLEQDEMHPDEKAKRLVAFLAVASRGRPDVAAELAATVLRHSTDDIHRKLADALVRERKEPT